MKTAPYPKSFLLLAPILLLAAGCSVVKTPYFVTDYYKETVAGLESLKSQTPIVKDSLFAGFSRISITPDLDKPISKRHKGIPIAGFGQLKPKYATGVHDSIFVRALALKAGTQTVVLVSVDMLIMPPNLTDAVVKSLSEKGIRREQLFFTAVHSHSSIGGWGYGPVARIMAGKQDKELEKWIVNNIEEAVVRSIADLKKSSIGTGSFMAPQYTRNRLTGDEEQINNEFNFIAIEQEGGKKCLAGTYSAHSTAIGSKNTLLSADYPGAWIRQVEDKSGYMAMFCGGSMGSQSPVGEGADFERASFIGNALADSTLKHLKDMHLTSVVSTSSLSLRTELPEYHMRMTRNRNFTTAFSNSLMAQPENVYLQALRINNLIWFTTPGDFSGEAALLIKNLMEAKGYEAVVSGYNGTYIGYIIPGKYFYLNNYEPKGMGWFGPTMGDYVTEILLRMGNAVMPRL